MTIKELKEKLAQFDDALVCNKVSIQPIIAHLEVINGNDYLSPCYSNREGEFSNYGCCERAKQLRQGPPVRAVRVRPL